MAVRYLSDLRRVMWRTLLRRGEHGRVSELWALSDRPSARTRARARRLRSDLLARRLAKTLFRRSASVNALLTERRNLRTAKGILQLEKGELEAVVRDLHNRITNPPGPHPPTNPTGYIPATVRRSGQAYREYLTRQIYEGELSPAITGPSDAGEFLQIVRSAGEGTSSLRDDWTVFELTDASAAHSRKEARSLPAEWTERFAAVLCNAVLEHVPSPQRAVDDFHRVLKPGGHLYLEVAFWQPYFGGLHQGVGEAPFVDDYWRATVEGLRIWAAAFDEISCGWGDEGVAYFFGSKPGQRSGAEATHGAG